jgi:high-affinity nickel-transport protein
MVSLLTIVAIGFLLGMRHATDPDHVVAVSTIVTREHDIKRSAWIGVWWGVGHTLTILAVGGAIILFRITLPPQVGLGMELAVGLMLIGLGLRNLGGMFSTAVAPLHHHSHDGGHGIAADRWFQKFAVYQSVRPLIVGIVHGLAGSAAIALLVLSAIANLRWAVVYLAVFGIGTILGMMLITLAIGSTFAYGQRRFSRIGRHFEVAAGLISLVFGVFIAYQIGFVNGLFTSHATWIPR